MGVRDLVLIVTQHGSHGDSCDLEAVKQNLCESFEAEGKRVCRVSPLVSEQATAEQLSVADVVMWETDACRWFGTERGVQACATIVSKEFDDFAMPLFSNASRVRLAMVGHSMGGLILRDLLQKSRVFCDQPALEPTLFMTIATPHLGSHQVFRPLAFAMSVWGMLFSHTCQDMLLENGCLEALCSDAHLSALWRFTHRVACANVARDYLCGYNSCALTTGDPTATHHPNAKFSQRIREEVRLTSESLPSEQEVQRTFPGVAAAKLSVIVKLMQLLRQQPWSLVAIDHSDSYFMAHTNIIGMGTEGSRKGSGAISAEYLSSRIQEALEPDA
ncbi:hypothetical protein DIPPA_28053 [Diplonema papillatum]|nr:hypothetical protein DIPPA_28053 [Diplonema papillatum]